MVSSHILSEMELMCDRVAVINQGKIVKIESLNSSDSADSQVAKEVQCVIKVKDIEKGVAVLKDKLNKEPAVNNGKIFVKAQSGEISSILKILVLNDVEVEYANENEHTLEDLFFDVTKGEKKDE